MIIKDMVLQKRPDYESNGYHVPTMPHIPRSARGKRSARKKVEDNQMCAFDLLATVAGKLLSERENEVSTPCNTHGTSSPTYANDTMKEIKLKNFFRVEAVDQQRCCDSQLSLEIAFKREIDFGIQENSYASKASASNFDSITIKNDKKDKDIEVGVSTISDTKDTNGPLVNSILDKCNTNSLSVNDHKGLGFGIAMQTERNIVKNRIDEKPQDMSTSKDLIDLETKHPTLVRNENSVEVPMFVNDIPRCRSFPKLGDDMEFFTDKDDENCFRCIHPSILSSEASRPHRIGYRRIKKLLASKYWKLAPSLSHDNEHSNYNVDTRPDFCGKKICYTRQRTQRGPFKRKKLFEQCSMSTRETYCEGLCTLIEKDGIKLEANDSNETLCEANGASSSSITGQKSSPEPQDYHVKVNIKSFRVPELFIEIPETATVGSLKRTVMEAVTAILGRGLRIGVLLHGKKVRDDNKTLSQVGISHNDKLDSLGFTLEPKPTQTSMQTTYEDPHFLNLADHVDPSTRIPPINPSSIDEGNIDATTSQLLLTACPESGHDPVHSLVDASSTLDKSMANSQALVVVPPVNVEALAMVPLRKSRRSEVAQRRIRRPFTVAEVDALVQAVEKLGTGRWRDVKLRAFDNAKHRTYVDLKDKWKTLVHTARISPQQRRGEPVPQELLDRVLSAHAYWSQQQAKLQIKPPPVDTCLLI